MAEHRWVDIDLRDDVINQRPKRLSTALQNLIGSGLSLRAIASATGDSHETVRQTLAGVKNLTPVLDESPAVAELLAEEAETSEAARDEPTTYVTRTGEVGEDAIVTAPVLIQAA